MGNRIERQRTFFFIWLFIGMLFSGVLGIMSLSGRSSDGTVFSGGEIYDYGQAELTRPEKDLDFDMAARQYTVLSNGTKKIFSRPPQTLAWKIVDISVGSLNTQTAQWTLRYYGENGEVLSEQECTIVPGENRIIISEERKFQKFAVVIKQQKGLTFSIISVRLRESDESIIRPYDFLQKFLSFFGAFLMVSALVWMIWKKKLYCLVDFLQDVYGSLGDFLGRAAGRLVPLRKQKLRIACFGILYLFMLFFQAGGWYQNKESYKYGIFVSAVLLITAGILLWEGTLKKVSWKGILPVSWFLFWGWTCISDLLESKNFKFAGYVMIFAAGFFFYMWNNVKRPQKVSYEMMKALEYTLPVTAGYCLLFRPKLEGILYNGIFSARQDMAVYALALFLVFLADFDSLLKKNSKEAKNFHFLLNGMGIGLSMYFLFLTDTFSCRLAAVVVGIAWLVHQAGDIGRFAVRLRKAVPWFILSAICTAVLLTVYHTGLSRVPVLLGTEITYAQEELETKQNPEEIAERRGTDEEYMQGVMLSGERNKKLIWENYLRKINLLGHGNMLKIAGERTMAYNGLLEVSYRYGLPAAVWYVLLLFFAFKYAFQKRSLPAVLLVISFIIVLLFQNIEKPFAQPLWIMFYLGMGRWFPDGERDSGQL